MRMPGSCRRYAKISKLNIPLVSEQLHKWCFGRLNATISGHQAAEVLTGHRNLMIDVDTVPSVYDVSLELPDIGPNLVEHLETYAVRRLEHVLPRIERLYSQLPAKPDKWVDNRPGWYQYTQAGDAIKVDYPPCDVLVLDTENAVCYGHQPTMCCAVSDTHWYSWLSVSMFDQSARLTNDQLTIKEMIPIGTNKLIIGHNVAFDRSKLAEEYNGETGNVFIDTMSMHNATHGLMSEQRMQFAKTDFQSEAQRRMFAKWQRHSSMSSLAACHLFYCPNEEKMEKETRSVFVKTTVDEYDELIVNDAQRLMEYCGSDVQATVSVFRSLYPLYIDQYPNPINLAGSLIMGSTRLAINHASKQHATDITNRAFDDTAGFFNAELVSIANKIWATYEDEWRRGESASWNDDLHLRHLDWASATLKSRSEPKWLRKLRPRVNKPIQISGSNRQICVFLQLTLDGNPIVYQRGAGSIINGVFTLIPNPNGTTANVGSVLAKPFIPLFKSGRIKSTSQKGQRLLEYWIETIEQTNYWRSFKSRFAEVMAVKCDNGRHVCLPRSIVHGTVTRRTADSLFVVGKQGGSVLGSDMFQAFECSSDQCYVSADVDSQEMWIAGLLADTALEGNCAGLSPMSYVLLQGDKDKGTDVHSLTAASVGLDRNQAKMLNYARLYSCGKLKAQRVLGGESEENKRLVDDLWKLTKGNIEYITLPSISNHMDAAMANLERLKIHEKTKKRFKDIYRRDQMSGKITLNDAYVVHSVLRKNDRSILTEFDDPRQLVRENFTGGIESAYFDFIAEKTIQPKGSKLPVLGGLVPKNLNAEHCGNQFMTTRANWVIQSSAVDFLHIFIVAMEWLIEQYQIDATFAISVHDQIRYLSSADDAERTALAFQIAHLQTRAFFSTKCAIYELPQNCAFFSSVEIDSTLRKDVHHTSSLFPHVEPGRELTISDICELTRGSLVKKLP